MRNSKSRWYIIDISLYIVNFKIEEDDGILPSKTNILAPSFKHDTFTIFTASALHFMLRADFISTSLGGVAYGIISSLCYSVVTWQLKQPKLVVVQPKEKCAITSVQELWFAVKTLLFELGSLGITVADGGRQHSKKIEGSPRRVLGSEQFGAQSAGLG